MSNVGPHNRCGTAIPGLDHFLAAHSSTLRRLEEDRDGIGNLQAAGTRGRLAPDFAMCLQFSDNFSGSYIYPGRAMRISKGTGGLFSMSSYGSSEL
jgi:hypothetical protein